MGEKRNAYRILVVKPEGKRLLGSLDVLGTWYRLDYLAQVRDRLRAFVNMGMNCGFHKIFGNS
jgi:hypothetical protein